MGTGAIPWRRASAQVMRPLRLSSHSARASTPAGFGRADDTGGTDWVRGECRVMSVEGQLVSIRSTAAASARSIVRAYLRRTSSVRAANQHAFTVGVHSATSLPLFWERLRRGCVRGRFSRAQAKAALTGALAAYRPLSWASTDCG